MKSLIKNISIYATGDLLNKVAQFLLLPLYTNLLLPVDYGTLELIYLVGSILVIINGLLVQNAYARFYFDTDNSNERKTIFSTCLFFIIICSLFSLATGLIYSNSISNFIFGSSDYSIYIILIGVSSLLSAISWIPDKYLIVREKATVYVSINVIDVIATLFITIYLVVISELGILGILLGQICGRSIRLTLLLIFSFHEIQFSFSVHRIKEMISFSIYLIPAEISALVAYMSNRVFIQNYTDLTQVGIFSLGFKIASIIPILITGPIKKAFRPYIFSLIKKPDHLKETFSNFIRYYFIAITSFSFILSLFSKELLLLIANERYSNSYSVIFPLSISYIIIGYAGLIAILISITKNTKIIGLAWIIGAIVNLILNYLLVPVYGIIGATYATILTFLTILIIYICYQRKNYPINIDYNKFALLLIVVSVFYYGIEIINFPIISTIFLKLLIYLLYVVFIWFGNFLKVNEKKYIKNKIKGIF